MRRLLIICSILACLNSYGQLRFGLAYYQDSINFNRSEKTYDASYFLNSWTDFLRFTFEVPINDKYEFRNWLDMDDTFSPEGFKVGFRRNMANALYIEAIVKNKRYSVYNYDYNYISNETDYYYSTWLFGTEFGYEKTFKKLRITSGAQIALGTKGRIGQSILKKKNNYRAIHEFDLYFSNMISSNIHLLLDYKLLIGKRLDWSIFYNFRWRHDYFNFKSNAKIYEWTADNLTSNQDYKYRQSTNSLQHHFGIAVNIHSSEKLK